MRAQSFRAASRCEHAKGKTCKCRCQGRLHGAARNLIEEGRAVPGFFEALPEDDPHYVPSAEERKHRAKLKRIEREAHPQELLWGNLFEGEEA